MLRDALKQSHADEQRYRDEQLARLQRLKADILRKQDTLLNRLLDDTITREVYDAKNAVLDKDRQGGGGRHCWPRAGQPRPPSTHGTVPGERQERLQAISCWGYAPKAGTHPERCFERGLDGPKGPSEPEKSG